MRTTILRLVALTAAATIVLSGIQTPVGVPPASASIEDSTFVFSSFPVDTSAVKFRDSWGDRRPGGRRHQGTDILSRRGTAVVAIADGVVTKMALSDSSGYYIRIDHGAGWVSSYLHLNNDIVGTDNGEGGTWTAFYATLEEGQQVSAGDIIGYVGDSGNAEHTTPHLHLEIKQGDQKQNPFPYLDDVWTRSQLPWVSPQNPR